MHRLRLWWKALGEKRAERRRRYPVRWLSNWWLVSHELKLIHQSTPELLTPEFAKAVSDARSGIYASAAKYQSLVFLGIAFLVLAIFKIDLPISFPGATLKTGPGVSEVLILFIAAASAAAAGKTVAVLMLSAASKTLMNLVYDRETVYLQTIIHHQNEPPPLYRPTVESLEWTKLTMWTQLFSVLLMTILLVVVLGGSVYARVQIYQHVWAFPSLEPFWSRTAVALAAVTDLAWVAFVAIYVVPLPYRDYRHLDAYSVADKVSPSFARAVWADSISPTALADLILRRFR